MSLRSATQRQGSTSAAFDSWVGEVFSSVSGGLTILAWVALWRPGELLLYDWYPFRRKGFDNNSSTQERSAYTVAASAGLSALSAA